MTINEQAPLFSAHNYIHVVSVLQSQDNLYQISFTLVSVL